MRDSITHKKTTQINPIAATGIAFDCGEGVCHTVPIYDGYALPHSILKSDIGGKDITEYLILLLKIERGVYLDTQSEIKIAKDIKEKLGYVMQKDCETDINSAQHYQMPDGQMITLGKERFRYFFCFYFFFFSFCLVLFWRGVCSEI